MRSFVGPLSRAVRRRQGWGAGDYMGGWVFWTSPRRGASAMFGTGGRLPSVPPLAPGSLPLAGRWALSGMTVWNTCAFASRGGARECYFIPVGFEGDARARAGSDALGRG